MLNRAKIEELKDKIEKLTEKACLSSNNFQLGFYISQIIILCNMMIEEYEKEI